MSCERITERLADFLEDRLSDVERRAVEEHLEGCAECRDLVATLRTTLDALVPGGEPPPGLDATPDLASAILARTSGPACGRAQSFLCDLVDGLLDPSQADLVAGHVEHCSRCAALCDTLAWLRVELPQMAELDPGVGMASAVLQATTGFQPRRKAAHRAVGDALRRWWDHVVARPRFAWEAAYVATLVGVLLFGTSVSPFRGVPARALAAIQFDPRTTTQTTGSQLRQLRDGIGVAGGAVWSATGGRVTGGVERSAAAFAAEHPGMAEAWSDMGEHSGDLRRALGARNLAEASLVMRSLNEDVQAFWQSYRAKAPAAPDSTQPAP